MFEKVYINKKTGRRYLLMFYVLNCTNANDGQKMIAYQVEKLEFGEEDLIFVREEKEFFEKFEEEK